MKKDIFLSIKKLAKQILPHGARLYLYGSQARGDEHEDSDWDILILLDKDKIQATDFNAFAYPIVELGWKLNANVSPQLYTKKEWESMSFMPYHKNVEYDKIVLL